MEFPYIPLISTGLWITLVVLLLVVCVGVIPLIITRNRYTNLTNQAEIIKHESELRAEIEKDSKDALLNSQVQSIIEDFGNEIKLFFDLILNNLEVILLKVKFSEIDENEILHKKYEILNAIENCINQVNYFIFSREILNSIYSVELSEIELISFFRKRVTGLQSPTVKANVVSTELEIYGKVDSNLLGILTRAIFSYAILSSGEKPLELIIRISVGSEHRILITFQFNSRLEYKEIYRSLFERSLYFLTREYKDRNNTPVNLLLIKKIVLLHDGEFNIKESENSTLLEIKL